MSRRALAEKRPFLLASMAAALAFYVLRWGAWPELYLIPVKGAAAALLAVYLWMRHSSPDARLMAWAFGAASLGDMAIEFGRTAGGLLFFAYHVMALGVYLRNRRESLAPSQKWAAAAMLLLTPLIAWSMPADRAVATNLALYGLALGAMAASAWARRRRSSGLSGCFATAARASPIVAARCIGEGALVQRIDIVLERQSRPNLEVRRAGKRAIQQATILGRQDNRAPPSALIMSPSSAAPASRVPISGFTQGARGAGSNSRSACSDFERST